MAAPTAATNTLSFRLVRPAEAPAASLDDDFAELRTRCQRMGHVRSAVIFKTHRRATVVFDTDDEAALARANLHQLRLPSGTVLTVTDAKVPLRTHTREPRWNQSGPRLMQWTRGGAHLPAPTPRPNSPP